MIKTFIKRPVKVQAVQWTGDNYDAILNFTGEGNHYVSLGDWIIRGVAGEFYPCKPDIFEKTYEETDRKEK